MECSVVQRGKPQSRSVDQVKVGFGQRLAAKALDALGDRALSGSGQVERAIRFGVVVPAGALPVPGYVQGSARLRRGAAGQ